MCQSQCGAALKMEKPEQGFRVGWVRSIPLLEDKEGSGYGLRHRIGWRLVWDSVMHVMSELEVNVKAEDKGEGQQY
jgi:hypothetical protein